MNSSKYLVDEYAYKLPANPAALFWMTVGSGGLHMIINSWSDCMTTPGNCGNQIRTCTNPYENENEWIIIWCHPPSSSVCQTRTFRFRTPHRVKSVIFKWYAMPSGSAPSGRIEHARSVSGLTFRSSANSGAPLNPTGFFSRAFIESAAVEPCDENEHWISLTAINNKQKLAVKNCDFLPH